jgi:hypothetical protein
MHVGVLVVAIIASIASGGRVRVAVYVALQWLGGVRRLGIRIAARERQGC